MARRRVWLLVSCIAMLAACGGERRGDSGSRPADAAKETPPTNAELVRVAAVNTTISSGLLPSLATRFTAETGIRVELIDSEKVTHGKRGRGKRLFRAARDGHVDLVIAHYGKAEVQQFVAEGYGEFPRLVFANQVALIGPADDPAGVTGMTDAAAALAKIARARAPYVENNLDGLKYLSDVLWRSAGAPDKTGWYQRGPEKKAKAVRLAEKRGGYVLFGVQPFLYFKGKHKSTMRIQVWRDSVLQRAMATVVVRPTRVPGVNHAGAAAFQRYLLSAHAQARIRTFRVEGSPHQHWWPLARSNNPSDLTSGPAAAERTESAVDAAAGLRIIDERTAQRTPKMKLTEAEAAAAKTHIRRELARSPVLRRLHAVMPHSTVELCRAVGERGLPASEADRIAAYLVHLTEALDFAKRRRFDINHSHVTGREWHQIDYTGEGMTWQSQKKFWSKKGVADFKRAEHVHAYMKHAFRMPHFARVYAPRNDFDGVAAPPAATP